MTRAFIDEHETESPRNVRETVRQIIALRRQAQAARAAGDDETVRECGSRIARLNEELR